MNRSTKQGAPDYHITSAQSQTANRSVPRRRRSAAEIERENQTMAFKAGLFLGFGIAALAFAIILWAWVIPTMENAVSIAQGMVA